MPPQPLGAAGDEVEWGACLGLKDGAIVLVHRVRGDATAVTPPCTDVNDAEHGDFVGFVHTHPPDGVTRRPYLGFGELDFRATLADGSNLEVVCNGPEVFALVRAADCTQPRRVMADDEFAAYKHVFSEEFKKGWAEMTAELAAGRTRSDALDRALWRANRQLCRDLGFAFYRGELGRPLSLVFRPLPGGPKS